MNYEENDLNDKNIQAIEKLSEELEQFYKKLELLQKENNLFESYLKRMELSQNEDITKNENQKNDELRLNVDQKYEIALDEEQHLKKKVEEYKKNTEVAIETLKAIIEERQQTIKEIRKEALEFQRILLQNGTDDKIQKIESSKVMKFRQYKLKEKEVQLKKIKEKKKTIEEKLKKIEKKLKKRNIGTNDLKFIDFHQLQIENRKFLKQLEERNLSLQNLKIQTASIQNKLNNSKANLLLKLDTKDKYIKNIELKETQIKNVKKEKEDIQNAITKIQKHNDKLQLQKSKMEDNKDLNMKIQNFISDKETEKNLLYQIKNLKRKHEIIDFQYQQALKRQKNSKLNLPYVENQFNFKKFQFYINYVFCQSG